MEMCIIYLSEIYIFHIWVHLLKMLENLYPVVTNA